jgi:hypothetical protein
MAVSLWVGSVTFFSFVAAPAIFRTLPRAQAGDVVGAIFPKYYWVGHFCGALALGALILAARAEGWSAKVAAAALILVVMLGANIYSGFVVQPKVVGVKAEIRQATSSHEDTPPPDMKERFDRLHKLSVQLNVVVLIGGLMVLAISSVGLKL